MIKVIGKFSVLWVILLFIFSFPGNGVGAEVGVTDTSVLVGCSNSFSGPLVYPGTQLVNFGLEMYFKRINGMGGVNGRNIMTILINPRTRWPTPRGLWSRMGYLPFFLPRELHL
jgi:hypothetical protein